MNHSVWNKSLKCLQGITSERWWPTWWEDLNFGNNSRKWTYQLICRACTKILRKRKVEMTDWLIHLSCIWRVCHWCFKTCFHYFPKQDYLFPWVNFAEKPENTIFVYRYWRFNWRIHNLYWWSLLLVSLVFLWSYSGTVCCYQYFYSLGLLGRRRTGRAILFVVTAPRDRSDWIMHHILSVLRRPSTPSPLTLRQHFGSLRM